MDLSFLSQIAQILGGVTVLAAVVFGIAQLRQFQQQRRDAAAVELMRSLQDGEFTRAFRLIISLPEGMGAADLRAKASCRNHVLRDRPTLAKRPTRRSRRADTRPYRACKIESIAFSAGCPSVPIPHLSLPRESFNPDRQSFSRCARVYV